jgi:hypothetical protein
MIEPQLFGHPAQSDQKMTPAPASASDGDLDAAVMRSAARRPGRALGWWIASAVCAFVVIITAAVVTQKVADAMPKAEAAAPAHSN